MSKRGRPPATEARIRFQFTLTEPVYQEITAWCQTGALAPTISGSVQYIIQSWLEANRGMLPLLVEANAMQQAIIRAKRNKTVRKALRTKTGNVIAARARGFISPLTIQDAIDEGAPEED